MDFFFSRISNHSIHRIVCAPLEMLVRSRMEVSLRITCLECGDTATCILICSSKQSLKDFSSSSLLLFNSIQCKISFFKARSDPTACRITYKLLSLIFSWIMLAYLSTFILQHTLQTFSTSITFLAFAQKYL